MPDFSTISESLLAINGLKIVLENTTYLLEGALLTLQITTLSVLLYGFGFNLGV